MLLEYTPGNTFLHKAGVVSKLFAFVILIIVTFLITRPSINLVLAGFTILLLFLLKIGARAILKIFAPLVVIVVLIFLFAVFSPPHGADTTVLANLLPGSRLSITIGGVEYGANLALRILTMVAASAILIISTPIEQFTTLMQQLRMPHALVFIAVTSLRFVPTMQTRSEQILDAQRARGAQIDSGSLLGKIRAYVTIMVPLFSTGIRMSEELSCAMLSRGYGVVKQPTRLYDLKWGWVDSIISLLSAVLLLAAITYRFYGL
ncbi:energy-coupling factor transporter transmembrane component T family protein [Trueperella pyogenes]|uniref:energy-coupling factor transporter transmembrane component T family protein n=1 Tax=Trueperella pyogenes TaxID=1661 RepID=UPI00312B81BF